MSSFPRSKNTFTTARCQPCATYSKGARARQSATYLPVTIPTSCSQQSPGACTTLISQIDGYGLKMKKMSITLILAIGLCAVQQSFAYGEPMASSSKTEALPLSLAQVNAVPIGLIPPEGPVAEPSNTATGPLDPSYLLTLLVGLTGLVMIRRNAQNL